jgi:hypothetical protein
MPPRPNGITTALIIASFVAPSAYAAWIRSNGVWSKISREIAVTIGMIMTANTNPAINGERSKTGAGKSKMGINPRYLLISLAQYSADDIKTINAQKPKSKEGNAAIKSITDIRNFFSFPFA